MSSLLTTLLVASVFVNAISLCAGRNSGFYADNGIDQTVFYQHISRKERREMQQEILSLLGLHHRPKPTSHGTENSAPKYMMNLYNSFIDEESGNLKVDYDRVTVMNLTKEDLTEDSVHAINDADIIMSFVNHGWRKSRRCRKLKVDGRVRIGTCRKSEGSKNSPKPKAAHHLAHIRHDKDRRFWFDVNEVPAEEEIMEAQLRLYKETPPSGDSADDDVQYTVSIFKLVQGQDAEDKKLELLDVANVSTAVSGWIKLNVTSAASDWVAFPEKNLGLYMKIHREGHNQDLHPREIGLMGNKGPADRQPFMVAFFKTSEELHIRKTRSAARKQLSDSSLNDPLYSNNNPYSYDVNIAKRSCQSRTLFVSFSALGWQDWIIAPDGYAAFYCHGECSFPLNAQMNATNHAIVQTLVNLMKPNVVPKPCCAPTKLSAISVLYFDDNSNVILKKYRNMVVKACGCH